MRRRTSRRPPSKSSRWPSWKATQPYDEHASEVRALQRRLEEAHEFAKGRLNNKISAQQWKILIDPNGNLLGGFLQRWKNDSSLNETFVTEKKNR
jgi:hypothetical protein